MRRSNAGTFVPFTLKDHGPVIIGHPFAHDIHDAGSPHLIDRGEHDHGYKIKRYIYPRGELFYKRESARA